jgi:TAT (twin-arginine translocation) pathway signal sequence
MGSKLRCIRSTPTETQSVRENNFDGFGSTGVNTPGYNVWFRECWIFHEKTSKA